MDDKAAKQNRRRLRNVLGIFNRLSSELNTLRELLAEIPTHLATIEAMEDEAARCSAKVLVRDAVRAARILELELYRVIRRLEHWLGERVPVSANSATTSAKPRPSDQEHGPGVSPYADDRPHAGRSQQLSASHLK